MDKQEEMNQQQTFVRMEQQQQKHLFLISGIGFVQIILETILLHMLTKQPVALLMAEPILLLLQKTSAPMVLLLVSLLVTQPIPGPVLVMIL